MAQQRTGFYSTSSLLCDQVMTFCEFILHEDTCRQTLYELGQLSAVQFIDEHEHLANKLLRPCIQELRGIEDMERKLRMLADEVRQEQLEEYIADAKAVAHDPRLPVAPLDDIAVRLLRFDICFFGL